MTFAGNRLAESILKSTALFLALFLVTPSPASTGGSGEELSLELRAAIMAPVLTPAKKSKVGLMGMLASASR